MATRPSSKPSHRRETHGTSRREFGLWSSGRSRTALGGVLGQRWHTKLEKEQAGEDSERRLSTGEQQL